MARMYQTDLALFPHIGSLVQRYLPSLPATRGRTWQAFVHHSTLPANRAHDAVQWGKGPQLRFTSSYLPRSLVGRFIAGSDPGSAAIWIRSSAAREIEQDWARWEARLRTEALILHEMTHWGDWIRDNTMARTETGENFERDAYAGFQPVRFNYRLFPYPASLEQQSPHAS